MSQGFLCLSEKRKLKLREVKHLTQSYTGKHWQSQDTDPKLPDIQVAISFIIA